MSSERVSSYVTCFNCGEKGHRASDCKKSSVIPGGSGFVPRVVTCYNCGKVGHRSPECTVRKGVVSVKKEGVPIKMSVLRNGSKSGMSGNVAIGLVNVIRTEVLIDSGAELGSVPKALVPEQVVLCSDVLVKGYGGSEKCCKCFLSEFVIGGYSKVIRAIIDESELPRVSCIVPFSVTNGEEAEAYKCAIQDYVSGENVKMNVLTRSMVREEKELDRCEENVGETDLWCVVTPESGSGSAPEMVQEASSRPDPLIMPEVESRVGEGHGVDEVEVVLKPDKPQAKASEATSVVESVSESDELGEAPLDELSQLSGEEARLCELASEIGPVKEGSDGVEFRDELLTDYMRMMQICVN